MLLSLWPLFISISPPPHPQIISHQAGGAKHQNRKRRRILPDEEIDLRKLQITSDVSQSLRQRTARRREEELLN